ncbi:phosphoribosylglycinamide formyltransferase [Sulfuricurvum sp. IAE1]|jgi:phosphoribosylglycinamide formyltransferase-1|uniref:phosphoribosylglycinamide formyltransferase n=1 Tax=Sulfuricurvum sp. IAE1 TaxID=2546102 RepID=UPI00104F0853|nr:phosphoribosylglycinamide formyltransferase [Sulfuricurvum sp. IAE1]MDD3770156.1 phosphoribosylglycinamide formyltransferase [Sulfuricurvum sp.]MDX9965607.1 phosphoribosylglycinamide formyltransferase [Sulfuricurvum sp.]TDA68221.1 phosphoribosylglycinamide formyltransferase [Sulfuricurvum sp. IAE1]
MKKIVALFSGEGTNLANLIDKLHLKHCAIVCAITNNPEAGGIAKARAAGIPVDVLDHRDYESRESYDAALVKLIDEYQPDLVVLCGFMRILTPVFTSQVRSINLHPSLLPAFKGARAIERSFESDEKTCGVSVHWVSDELDGGEVIMQKSFVKSENETLESFTAKIRAIEHDILPLSVIALLKEA